MVLLLTCAAALAVLSWRGVSVRYLADDFWTASIVVRRGFWESQRFWYERWSGRFAYAFVIGILERIGAWIVPSLVALTIAAWTAASALLLRRIGRHSWLAVTALAAAVVYATAEGTIDVPQSILWQTGLVTYVVPLVGLTAWLATTAGRDSVRWYDALAPFVLAGFSEVTALSQILAVAALALVVPRGRRIFAVALAASVLGLIAVAVAPGNAVRLAVTRPSFAPLPIAMATFIGTARFFATTFLRWGIALLLVFAASFVLGPRLAPRHAAAASAVALGSALATWAAATAALGVSPPSRTLIVPLFFFVIAAAVAGAALPRGAARWERFAVPALIVLALVPLVSAAVRAGRIPEAARFARARDALDAALRRSRGHEGIVAGAPGSIGTLLFITHDREAWSNRCIADYYGLTGIAAAPPQRRESMESLSSLPLFAEQRRSPGPIVRLRFPR